MSLRFSAIKSEWQALNLQARMALVLACVLLFVFSLPHAMALRKLLLVAVFLLTLKPFLSALRQRQLVPLVFAYALLQAWMLAIAVFVADNTRASLVEWVGQWFTADLAFVGGIGLAALLMQAPMRSPFVVVALAVAVPITVLTAANDAAVLLQFWRQKAFTVYDLGISDHHATIGHAIALLAPLMVADALNRMMRKPPLLPVPVWLICMVLAILVFSLIAAGSRNGLMAVLLAIVLGGILMSVELRKIYPPGRIALILSIFTIFTVGYVATAIKSDPRWQKFAQTIPLAWNVDRDRNWLSGNEADLPMTFRQAYDVSGYYRIAWAHEAWRRLLEHPWGTEISRGTFHRLELEKYGSAGMAHSHNGWLDFSLNFGFPGLAIWAAFFFVLARIGWQAWRTDNDPIGISLVLLIALFAFRALLDSVFRDHMIEQFMLVAGLLAGALAFKNRRAELP